MVQVNSLKRFLEYQSIIQFAGWRGDFSAGNGTGAGGESIYGGVFEDEAFIAKHDQPHSNDSLIITILAWQIAGRTQTARAERPPSLHIQN
jgi:hypothetical protein